MWSRGATSLVPLYTLRVVRVSFVDGVVAEGRRFATAAPSSIVGKETVEFVHVFEGHARAAHNAGQRVFGNEHRETGFFGEQTVQVAQ